MLFCVQCLILQDFCSTMKTKLTVGNRSRMEMRQQDLLIHKLKEYAGSDMYPFHMPGHKRTGDMGFPDPFTMDITEVDGFDNLHHPEGILKSSMDWAAHIIWLMEAAAGYSQPCAGQCPGAGVSWSAGTATSPCIMESV